MSETRSNLPLTPIQSLESTSSISTDTSQPFTYEVGTHTWPCTEFLASFISSNRSLFKNKIVLELGSGAGGVCGITCALSKAAKVYLTDKRDKEIMSLLLSNIQSNKVGSTCSVLELDWTSPLSIMTFISYLEDNELDWIVASDVFYSGEIFEPLLDTINSLLEKFPKCQVLFTYQDRSNKWKIQDKLVERGLKSCLIRKKETDLTNCLQLGLIYKKNDNEDNIIIGGIEGGATQSKVVFINMPSGEILGTHNHTGSNYFLSGVQKTGDSLAKWLREVKQSYGIKGPLFSLGMGLSGAEDELLNKELIDYLLSQHGDIATKIVLESDSIATLTPCFDNGGAIMIAGTGSSTRYLTKNGKISGVGGWGHAIGDGGSGYWIANRGLRRIFDVEDGLEEGDISILREVIFNYFGVIDKIELLDLLYSKFKKDYIASVTAELVKRIDDNEISRLFNDAGCILGKQMHALIKKIPLSEKESRQNMKVLAVGSVFESWKSMKDGFIKELDLDTLQVRKMTIYRKNIDASIGAAVLGSKGTQYELKINIVDDECIFDTIEGPIFLRPR